MMAFSTANRLDPSTPLRDVRVVVDGPLRDPSVLSAVFRATVDATEEAVVNALLAAESSVGRDGHTYVAMPVDRVLELLDRAGRLAT
jgi:D-aminopeptidase